MELTVDTVYISPGSRDLLPVHINVQVKPVIHGVERHPTVHGERKIGQRRDCAICRSDGKAVHFPIADPDAACIVQRKPAVLGCQKRRSGAPRSENAFLDSLIPGTHAFRLGRGHLVLGGICRRCLPRRTQLALVLDHVGRHVPLPCRAPAEDTRVLATAAKPSDKLSVLVRLEAGMLAHVGRGFCKQCLGSGGKHPHGHGHFFLHVPFALARGRGQRQVPLAHQQQRGLCMDIPLSHHFRLSFDGSNTAQKTPKPNHITGRRSGSRFRRRRGRACYRGRRILCRGNGFRKWAWRFDWRGRQGEDRADAPIMRRRDHGCINDRMPLPSPRRMPPRHVQVG